MITIKKINIKIRVELIDGTTFPPENEENYIHDLRDSGYLFSLNKIKNYKDELIFQEEIFIPYTSIIKVRKEYEYQIDEQDIFKLIGSKLSEGITTAEIKKTLVGKIVKLSEEELRNILETLENDKAIVKDLNSWVNMEFSRRGLQLGEDMDVMREIERTQQLNSIGGFTCGNEKKKKFN